jgi:uncharacterized protein with HEPN domain
VTLASIFTISPRRQTNSPSLSPANHWTTISATGYCRRGVERQFEIVGEALSQLSKLDPALAKRVSDYQKIISFRNILIHGYADVDDELVWDIVETRLPILSNEIAQIIAEK